MDNQRQPPILTAPRAGGALGLIVALSGALRLWGLHWGLPIFHRFTPLYIDEYTPIHVLAGMNPRHFQFNPHYFVDPTFFYYQLGAVFQAASWAHLLRLATDQSFYLTHPDAYARLYLIGRLAIVAYALLATGLLYLLGRAASGSRAGGLLAALFYAVVPVAVVSAHAIDVAVPVSFWLGTTFFCLLKALRTEKQKWLWAGALCAGFSLSTKYTAAPILASLVYAAWKMRGGGRLIAISLSLALGGFLMGTPYAVLDFNGFRQEFLTASRYATGAGVPMSLAYFLSPFHLFPWAFGTPLLILCALGWRNRLRRRDAAPVLAALFLIPYFALMAKSDFHSIRYLNEALPFLFPFAAIPILWFFRRPFTPGKSLGGAVVLVLALTVLPYTLAIDRSLSAETDPRDRASEWICEHVPPRTVIGLENEANFMTPGQLYMQFWKNQRYPAKDVPPPDYDVVVWDAAQRRWPDSRVAFWVQNDYLFHMVRKNPAEAARILKLQQERRIGFHPRITFQRQVRWGPFHYALPPYPGLDWVIFFPSVTVYEKNL